MKDSLFVYGTLLIPEIQIALLGRKPNCKNAVLKDYSLYSIYKDKLETEYPVLKFTEGEEVNGNIIDPLSDNDLKLLCFYEGEDYSLKEVNLFVANAMHSKNTFMIHDSGSLRFGSKWNMNVFRKDQLQNYLTDIIPGILRDFKTQQKNLPE